MRKINECFDLTNKKIGLWTVLQQTQCPKHLAESHKSRAWWLCKCECGRISIVKGCTLRSGRSKSCGCRLVKKFNEIYYRK